MKDVREDLKAYIDGELPEARAQEVEAAIASDPALQQEVHFMRMLGFEIKRAASEAPVQGAAATIAKLRKPRASFGFMAKFPVLPALATVILVAGISAVIFPVFAQSKVAASDSVAMSTARKGGAMESENGLKGTGEATFGSGASSTSEPQASAGGGMSKSQAAPNQDWYEQGTDTSADQARSRSGFEGEADLKDKSDFYRTRDVDGAGGLTLKTKDNRVIDKKESTITPTQAHRVYKQPQLIRNADLSVKVESVHKAQSSISDLAKKLNGFVANTALNIQEDRTPEATMTFRVPVENFDAALIEIRNMGEVLAENSKSDDVTADVADKESRIVTYADMEKNLIAELAKTKDANLRFQIRNRLAEVRANLKSIKAQYAALRDVADFSTINLTFVGRPQGEDARQSQGWSDDTWTNATNSSRGIGRFFGAIGMYLLAYAPFWMPVVIVGWIVARKRRA